MILETKFFWPQQWIGLALGATFLMCVPMMALYGRLRIHLSVLNLIRLLLVSAICGCLLLAAGSHMMIPGCFLLGDGISFSTIYLADALANGIIQQNLLPLGSLFADANNFTWYVNLMSNGVGRTLGPWLARWCLQLGGFGFYIRSQCAVMVISGCVFEVMVTPGVSSGL